MMTIFTSYTYQDTVKSRTTLLQEPTGIRSDSVSKVKTISSKTSLKQIINPAAGPVSIVFADTTAVCGRNSISDITFYDPNNFVTKIESGSSNRFPFIFTEKNMQMQTDARASIIKQLRSGQDLPSRAIHADWIIVIIFIAAFLHSIARPTSKSMLPGVTRFFLFRGINDPSSYDTGGLFSWQATILNLISFLIIGLFVYCASSYNNFIPSGISGMVLWLISLGIIIPAVTLRHVVCVIAGNISGEKEAFREYLLGVYQSYRFSALFLFMIVILMSYTVLFSGGFFFISGIIVVGLMYLIRVIRLLIIFLNRNISIFYFILYLCALEILPVGILIKYFTGLV